MPESRATRPTRRAFLAGAAALLPAAACAEAPERAEPPRPRPGPGTVPAPAAAPPAAAPLDRGLSGRSGYALVDIATGGLVEGHDPDGAFVPASVCKVPTALFALDALGPAYRFATRLLATGNVVRGVLHGDLCLVGGGDPTLDTDALAALAARAAEAGVRRVAGRFAVHGGFLPLVPAIDPGQPVHVAYNPSVAGLNLNFNRVFLEWKPVGGERELVLEARALRHSPAVSGIRIETAARQAPVFTWERQGAEEVWTVSEPALGTRGGRWLPVRDPVSYAGSVFRDVAGLQGLTLPAPVAAASPAGTEIARAESGPLETLLHDMLRHSTNLTAEVVGLTAARTKGAAPRTLAESGAAMADWVTGWAALRVRPDFRNHSGLSPESRISPRDTALILAAAERRAPQRLAALLRDVALAPETGEPPLPQPALVAAKTGTLNFVRGLAGYLMGPNGRMLAFAIYAGDLAARDRAGAQDLERPTGSRTWLGRARTQERALLRHWLRRYGTA
jgi:D-alanyl-D-alanine carboxypeptidase/D-alanyl-D-alanine-endopeptidase (penicillin-binding protein 4)